MDRNRKILGNIKASMAMEGMPLTREDEKRVKQCMAKKTSYNAAVKMLVEKHTVKRAAK